MDRTQVCTELLRNVNASLELLRDQPDEVLLAEPVNTIVAALLVVEHGLRLEVAPGKPSAMPVSVMRAEIRLVLDALDSRRKTDLARRVTYLARGALMNAVSLLASVRDEDLVDAPAAPAGVTQ